MDMMEYRFKTIDSYGSILLSEKSVFSKMHRCGKVWEQETPLDQILPYPTRSTCVAKHFWWCVLIGLAGFIGGVWGVIDSEGTNMSMSWALILATGGVAFIVFAMRTRTETWIWFPTEISGHDVSYCKSGPDVIHFDSFTEQLTSKIRTARSAK